MATRETAKRQRQRRKPQVDALVAKGFDLTTATGTWLRPRCSQCEVIVIQGIACHETGCPHETHGCAECGEAIPRRQRLCDGCVDDCRQDEAGSW